MFAGSGVAVFANNHWHQDLSLRVCDGAVHNPNYSPTVKRFNYERDMLRQHGYHWSQRDNSTTRQTHCPRHFN